MSVKELTETAEARWGDLQQAFASGVAEGALLSMSARSRDKYRKIFGALADRRPEIAADMQPLSFYKVYGDLAIFKVKKKEVHAGKEYEMTHELHFQPDPDGVWRLRQL